MLKLLFIYLLVVLLIKIYSRFIWEPLHRGLYNLEVDISNYFEKRRNEKEGK